MSIWFNIRLHYSLRTSWEKQLLQKHSSYCLVGSPACYLSHGYYTLCRRLIYKLLKFVIETWNWTFNLVVDMPWTGAGNFNLSIDISCSRRVSLLNVGLWLTNRFPSLWLMVIHTECFGSSPSNFKDVHNWRMQM